MAEQRANCRAAQHAESFYLHPPALNQVLLHVLGVREGGVKEDQRVISQNGAANISAIGTAVACDAFVESGQWRRTHTVHINIHTFTNTALACLISTLSSFLFFSSYVTSTFLSVCLTSMVVLPPCLSDSIHSSFLSACLYTAAITNPRCSLLGRLVLRQVKQSNLKLTLKPINQPIISSFSLLSLFHTDGLVLLHAINILSRCGHELASLVKPNH